MSRMLIRWRDRDTAVDERSFEALVRGGFIPEDAWIISPTYTRAHAVQARDLEVYHLWRPEPEPPPSHPPSILGEIYLERRLTLSVVLLAANLVVAFVLLITWRGEYTYALRDWAVQQKLATRGIFDLPHLLPTNYVHASPGHLFGNLLYLFGFGAVVEYAFGWWRALLVYAVSGWAGSALSLVLLDSRALSVGASGAIFGLIGASFVYLVRNHRSFQERLRWRARRIYIPLVLAVTAYSLTGGNLLAHGGGLVMGAIVAAALGGRTRRESAGPSALPAHR